MKQHPDRFTLGDYEGIKAENAVDWLLDVTD